MPFGRNALWIKVGRPGQMTLPIITDLAAFPLSPTSFEISYFPNVPFYQYRIDGGTATALSSDTFTGLTASTLYTIEIRGGYFDIGPWSDWSNVASVTTHAVTDPAIGSIANLTAVAIGETSVQLAFTDAANAASYQYRIDGGSPVTLNAQRTVAGLTQNTEYDFEVRGANAALTIFGAYSNLVTETTVATPAPGAFDPINYLTAGEKAQLLDEYGITTIPFTRVWGVAGEPSCPYREPVYATDGSGIPANALDISAYGGNVANWLAAMETQQKPGKAGSGTYNAAGLVTIGTQSIYGYGATRPILNGEWRHYVQADNCRFQYLKRTNSQFWLVMQDNHVSEFMTGSTYRVEYFRGAASQYKRLADHTGFYVLDCAFDNVYWSVLGFHFNYRTKKFHVGRNTYRNGCKSIAGFSTRYHGDAILNGVNGIYCYGNDLDGAVHDPSAANHWGSFYGTIFSVFGYAATTAARATNGPDFFENNRVTNVIGCGLPRRSHNIAVVAHVSESDLHYVRYNEVEDVYDNLNNPESNTFYAYGTIKIEENYARRFGSGAGDINTLSFTTGTQDADGWNALEGPGAEAAFCAMKGGGGYNNGPSTAKNNVLIPMWYDVPVFHSGHKFNISENYVFNFKGQGRENTRTGLIRSSHPGQSSTVGTNYFVGCGNHPYDNRRPQWLFTIQGGGGNVQNATDDIVNLTVNYDGDRRDIFYQVDQITNSFNDAGLTLQKQTVFPPSCATRPTAIRSGGNFVINSNGSWHLGPTQFVGAVVPLTYEWYRDGVIIGGQTASTMSESQWTGTIEPVVVGTLNGKSTRAACLPFHKIVSELVPGGPASFTDNSDTTGVTQDYALGALTAGDFYRFTFTQNVTLSSVLSVKLTGTGGVAIRPGQIHRSSRAGSFVYEFQAQAGENNLRFITANSSIVTISGISCGKITGVPVMNQAW